MTDLNKVEEALDKTALALESIEGKLTEHDRLFETIRVIQDDTPAEPALDKLFGALAKAQTEIENAEQDAENTHWQTKYASLASVMSAIRAPLSKNGLAILQLPRHETTDKGTLVGLETILGHSSGQQISNYFSLYPPKQDPQGIGSALTYLRRYAAMAIVGIAGAADDDAEGTKAEAETITAAEADAIWNLADELFGDDANLLLERMCDKIFGVDGVPKIPAGEAEVAMQRIKNTRKRKDAEGTKIKKPEPAGPDVGDGPGGDTLPGSTEKPAKKKPSMKPDNK